MAVVRIFKQYFLLEIAAMVAGLLALLMVHQGYSLYLKINEADTHLYAEQAQMKEKLLSLHILLHEPELFIGSSSEWHAQLKDNVDHLKRHHEQMMHYLQNKSDGAYDLLHYQLHHAVADLDQWLQDYIAHPRPDAAMEETFDGIYLPMLELLDRHRDAVQAYVEKNKQQLDRVYWFLMLGLLTLIVVMAGVFSWYRRGMLKAHEQQQRAVMFNEAINENLVDGVVTINEHGIMEYVNPAVENIFGYSREELLGSNVSMLMAGEDARRHDDYMRNYLHLGVKKIIGIGREVLGRKKDSSLVPIYLGVSEYKIAGKRYFAGVLRDISEQKQYQRELLEQKRRAEVASQAKSEFLTAMTHEVRTPLNGVMGFLELLKLSDLSENDRDYVDTAFDSASSLLALLESVLEYSRLENGEFEKEFIEFDLASLLTGLVEQYRLCAEDKGLSLSVQIDPALPDVISSDAILFRQMLEQLLANAIKFTEEGGASLRAQLLQNDEERQLYLSVCDTGVGVRPEDRDDIFAAFKQADGSFTRSYGGVGLGLAIAKKIATGLGGSIGMEAREQGSCFWVTLPL